MATFEEVYSRGGDSVDECVGSNIRARRSACGIAAADMCQALGVTEAELEAWEDGRARPPGVNLLEIAHLLNVPAVSFFDGIGK